MNEPMENCKDIIDDHNIIGLTKATGKKKGVKVYDFKRPDKFSLDQIRTFHIMHETFARLLSALLSAALRLETHVYIGSVDQLTYEEFIRATPESSCLGILNMTPLMGNAVLQIDESLVYSFIDRVTGGNGKPVSTDKELSDIGVKIMEGIYARILPSLGESWSTIINLTPTLGQIETNPMFAMIVPPTEMVILASFQAKVGEATGYINLCIPYLTIEPLISKLSAQYWYSLVRKKPGPSPGPFIPDFPVDTEVYYQTAPLSLKEIKEVSEGKTIKLGNLKKLKLRMEAGGVPILDLTEKNGKYLVLNKDSEEIPGLQNRARENSQQIIENQFTEFRKDIKGLIAGLNTHFRKLEDKQEALSDQLNYNFQEGMVSGEQEPSRLRPFAFIRKNDAGDLATIIKNEYIQIAALILSYLDPETASRVLDEFPTELRTDLITRISRLDRIAPQVLMELEKHVEWRMREMASSQLYSAGGIHTAVDILNYSPRNVEKNVIETLEKENPELAEDIKMNMFVFEDIVLLDPEAIKTLLANIEMADLAIALQKTEENVKACILSQMEKEERESLLKNIEQGKKMRRSDVEARQLKIVFRIRDLEASGLIIVERPGDE